MTEKELLYVTTIAQEASISRAAQKLYITQPALSHCLSNLEQELGQPLFRRGSRGLTLTYAGERYCAAAREILRIYENLEQELEEMGKLIRGRVSIGMARFLSTALLPELLPKFKGQYPGVEVDLFEDSSTNLLQMLQARQLDFAVMNVTQEQFSEPEGFLTYRLLRREPFVIALSPSDPAVKEARPVPGGLPVLDPARLADHAFAMVSPGQRIRLITDRVLRQAGVEPKIILESSNYETARRVACSGLGAAMLPYSYTALLSGAGGAAYFAIPEEYEACFLTAEALPREGYLSPAARKFLEMVEEHYSK